MSSHTRSRTTSARLDDEAQLRARTRLTEIWRSAAATFVERGYDATSVHDIAAALGMTKAGLYHYIEGKEALLFDIISYSMDRLEADVVEPTRSIADPVERFEDIVRRHVMLVTTSRGALTRLVDEACALPPPQRRVANKRRRHYFEYVRAALFDAREAGRLVGVDPTVAAFSVLSIIMWLPRWFRPGGRLTSERLSQDLIVFLEGALGLDVAIARRAEGDDGRRDADRGLNQSSPKGRQRRLEARAFPNLNPRRFSICMTAARTFVERGYQATSVNDVASALGFTKAGLYHYIRSKEGLFFEILSLGMDWLDEDVIKHVQPIVDTEMRLRDTIARHASLTATNEPWITVLLDDMRALPATERQQIEQRKRAYFEMVRQMVRDLASIGRLRPVDPTVATQAAIAMIIGIPRWMNPNGRLTPEQVSAEVARMALDGMFAPDALAHA